MQLKSSGRSDSKSRGWLQPTHVASALSSQLSTEPDNLCLDVTVPTLANWGLTDERHPGSYCHLVHFPSMHGLTSDWFYVTDGGHSTKNMYELQRRTYRKSSKVGLSVATTGVEIVFPVVKSCVLS